MCRWCGQRRAALFWHGVKNRSAYPNRVSEEVLAVCRECVKRICGGLIIDLVLSGHQTEEEVLGSLRRRRFETSLLRAPFPLTDVGRKLILDAHGRSILVAVSNLDRDGRDGFEARYDLGVGVASLGEWLLKQDPNIVGSFEGGADYIDHLLGRD